MRAKRFLALMMAVLTLISVCIISGCSKSEAEGEKAESISNSRELVTLNMFIVTDEKTDSETAKNIQMEINRILVPEYKTMLKINYLTKEDYWSQIEKTKKQVQAFDLDGTLPEEMQFTQENKPVDPKTLSFNQLIDYIFDIDDITLTQPQLDLFIVDDYDKYTEMAFNGDLTALDEFLLNDEKILNQYIHPTFLSAAKVANITYGVPTNHGLSGEFTYFVFNKDLLDRYGYKMEDLNDYAKLGDYLQLIKRNVPGVWPISGPCHKANTEVYEDAFVTTSTSFNNTGSGLTALLKETSYVNYLKAVQDYKQKGYYPSQNVNGAKYAIEIVKTDEILEKEWTQNGTTYCTYLYDVPRVTSSQAFKSAMCISSLSKHPDRAMELITLFNTDAELANLLQYGINGQNYYLDRETGSITMLNDTYVMDTLNTGNTYIKYQLEGNESYVEDSKKINNLLAQSSFLGFNPYFAAEEYNSIYSCYVATAKAAIKRIENGEDIDTVKSDMDKDLIRLGYLEDANGNLQGVFGAAATDYSKLERSFRLADEITYYNTGIPDAKPEKEQQTSDVLAQLATTIDGVTMYDLEMVCTELESTFVVVDENKYVVADGKCIATLDSTRYVCDGVPTELEHAPVVNAQKVFVPQDFVLSIKAIEDAKN